MLRAVAALEFVHASALVHDDVMDGAHTRRGRPATHVGFATRHAVEDLGGDGDLFGTGAAILVGDLALVWSDELLRTLRASPTAALTRARARLGHHAHRGHRRAVPRPAARRRRPARSGRRTEGRPLQERRLHRPAPAAARRRDRRRRPRGDRGLHRDRAAARRGVPAPRRRPRRVRRPRRHRQVRRRRPPRGQADPADRAGRAGGRRRRPPAAPSASATPTAPRAVRRAPPAPGDDRRPARVEERIAERTALARAAIAAAPLAADARAALDALAVAATTRTA